MYILFYKTFSLVCLHVMLENPKKSKSNENVRRKSWGNNFSQFLPPNSEVPQKSLFENFGKLLTVKNNSFKVLFVLKLQIINVFCSKCFVYLVQNDIRQCKYCDYPLSNLLHGLIQYQAGLFL